MPLDVSCPGCGQGYAVTEARHPVGVSCPACGVEVTAEFRRVPVPAPGESPYELRVTPGRPADAATGSAGRKPLPLDDDEARGGGGSIAVVAVVALTALALTVAGLGAVGYYLFTHLDAPTASNPSRGGPNPNPGNQPGNTGPNWNIGNQGGNKGPFGGNPPGGNIGGNPIPPPPPPTAPKDVFDLRPVRATPPPITAPDMPTGSKTIEVGGKVGAVAVGGGGRYLVMHVHDRGELKLFDVSKGEVTATVAADRGMNIKVAAGVSRAFLYAPTEGIFRVYSLPDLRKLFDAGAPMRGAGTLAIGSRTDGPMLMASGNEVLLANVSDSVTEVEGSRGRPGSIIFRYVRAAPDGTAFTLAPSAQPNSVVKLLTVADRRWAVSDLGPAVPFPGPDGNFYGAGGAVDSSGRQYAPAENGAWLVPSVSGNSAHLRIMAKTSPSSKTRRTLSVTVRDDASPTTREFIGYSEFDGFTLGPNLRPNLMLDEYFFLVPEANLLATLTFDRTKLVLRTLK